jgi:hypothetical protein
VLMTVLSAHAENPSFADVLARAKAQAAAGHRWTPPDDNMTETVKRMTDLIPTATPAQLSELSALIESSRLGPLPTTSKADLTTEDRLSPGVPPPLASPPPAPPAIAGPASPPVLPAHPGPDPAGPLALGQGAQPDHARPGCARTGHTEHHKPSGGVFCPRPRCRTAW